MKILDAKRRGPVWIWGLSIETYARHNPREAAFAVLSRTWTLKAVRDVLNIMFQHFTFYFAECPIELFAVLHEYTMWSIDPRCTDVAAEVAL